MTDGDFEPEGWSAFDDHGTHGEKGNAGCAVFFIVIVVIAVGYLPSVASFARQSGYSSAIIGKISGC